MINMKFNLLFSTIHIKEISIHLKTITETQSINKVQRSYMEWNWYKIIS